MISFDPVLVHDYLTLNAQRTPGKVALIQGDERWTYRQLDAWTSHLAVALREAGLQRQERVAILMDSCPQSVIAMYGALKANAVFVTLDGGMKAPKLQYILQNCGARILIAQTTKAAVVADALSGLEPGFTVIWVGEKSPAAPLPGVRTLSWSALFSGLSEEEPERPDCGGIDIDLATLIYTSGSTGEPKGVMSTHHNMLTVARSVNQYLENTPDDIVLNVLPLSYGYGLYQVVAAFMVGGTVVLEKSFVYLHRMLERIGRERVTGLPVVPTIVAMMLHQANLQDYDFSSLRYITNAGAALPVEHVRRLREALPHVRLYLMYGLTECQRVCFLPPEEVDRRPSSVGKPMPNCDVMLVDENGREVPPGEVGELVVRGSHVMQGYWGDPELTRRNFRPGRYPAERLLHSGDCFRRDEEGFLYYVSRKDDMIKCRGERVNLKEVENALHQFPGVAEAAVIAEPDEVLGHVLRAFLVRAPACHATQRDVLKFCTERIEHFMIPRHVEFLDALPKTPNGKIDRQSLKARCAPDPETPKV